MKNPFLPKQAVTSISLEYCAINLHFSVNEQTSNLLLYEINYWADSA